MLEGAAKTDIQSVEIVEPSYRGSMVRWMWAVGPHFYFPHKNIEDFELEDIGKKDN